MMTESSNEDSAANTKPPLWHHVSPTEPACDYGPPITAEDVRIGDTLRKSFTTDGRTFARTLTVDRVDGDTAFSADGDFLWLGVLVGSDLTLQHRPVAIQDALERVTAERDEALADLALEREINLNLIKLNAERVAALRIEDLVEASSLGTPAAKAARESVPDAVAAEIVARSRLHCGEPRCLGCCPLAAAALYAICRECGEDIVCSSAGAAWAHWGPDMDWAHIALPTVDSEPKTEVAA